jgi:8-oxo-dGTP pyrophosphatase MutT (NUDIX family)
MFKEHKIHYVAHTVIIVKNGKYLIVKRSSDRKAIPDKWIVPGGRTELSDYDREPDTSFGQWYNVGELVCQREVKEEVGIDIPLKELKYLTSIAFKHPDGIPAFINSYFVVLPDNDEQEVVLNKELADHAWVTLEEAKEYALIPGVWEEIEMADKVLKGDNVGSWELKH